MIGKKVITFLLFVMLSLLAMFFSISAQNNDDDILVNEITVALKIQRRKNKPSFSFTDDGLKNARLPIIVQ